MKKLSALTCVFLLLFVSEGFCASSRVLPTSYNESTYGDGTRDYTDLSTWEAATDNNLVTATSGEVLTCYDDNAPYDDSVVVNGATVNGLYFRVIRAAEGQRGTRTTGVRFEKTEASGIYLIRTTEKYSCFYDIAASAVSTSGRGICFQAYIYADESKFVGCTAYGARGTSFYNGIGFDVTRNSAGSINAYFVNCYAYDNDGGNSSTDGGFTFMASTSVSAVVNAWMLNCTSIGNSNGICIFSNSGTVNLDSTNCIVYDNDTNINITNSSGSPTHDQTTNLIAAPLFESDGYHIDPQDNFNAINAATPLYAYGTYPFDDDIDGDTRSRWDIGCDEAEYSSSRKLPSDYNESTYGDATRDYTDLSTWEAATDNNLVTATSGEVLTCYDDSASYTDDLDMAGATTDSEYFRVVRSYDVENPVNFTGASTTMFKLAEPYAQLHDMGITGTSNDALNTKLIHLNEAATAIVGCTVFDGANSGAGDMVGVFAYTSDGNDAKYIINSLIYGMDKYGVSAASQAGLSVYNTTIADNDDAGYSSFDSTIKNSIVQDNGSDTIDGGVSQTTCATSGVIFNDSDSGDYTLSASDTTAMDQGTDLSTDSVYAFDDDITGDIISGAWSIGCYALAASSTPTPTPDSSAAIGLAGDAVSNIVRDITTSILH